MAVRPHRQASVFGEIVDWILAPLLILWPIRMAIQYFLAYTIASDAYETRAARRHRRMLQRKLVKGRTVRLV